MLEETKLKKDLGVHVNYQLTFNHHIQQNINIATKMVNYIRLTFKNLDKGIFVLLYKSLVRHHLEFASSIWSQHTSYSINAIE